MSEAPVPQGITTSDRSSASWTRSSSAAGYTLRYLIPIRQQLIELVDSTEEADEGLRMMISHFVTAGFGDHRRGRLRDFFFKAIRSTIRTRSEKQNGDAAAWERLSSINSQSPDWIKRWSDGLVARVWRELERREHLDPSLPLFTVLSAASNAPREKPAMLSVRIAAESGVTIDPSRVERLLPEARRQFAQLLADEISVTLESPDTKAVKREIKTLGLAGAFRNLKG